MGHYNTILELANHALASVKGDDEPLREGDISRVSDNALGRHIAIEYDKILDKALWAKNWVFANKVFNTTVNDDLFWERCGTVLDIVDTDATCHHIGDAWLTEEFLNQKDRWLVRPNLIVILKDNTNWKIGVNLDLKKENNRDNIVKVNITQVPEIQQIPFPLAEHIEKELEIFLYMKITGTVDTNRYKITKQQSADALAEAMRADNLASKTNDILTIKRP